MPFSTASLVHNLKSFFPGVYQMNQNQAMTCRFHQSLQSSGFLALVQIDEILAKKQVGEPSKGAGFYNYNFKFFQ